MRPILMMLSAALAATPVAAQDPVGQAARERGAAALAARDFAGAEAAYAEALEIERRTAPGS
ncbi:MAG: hypothetical protein J0M36_13030, partial [Caulobacterales bacterium]|nr:hypothetical protein [Caulobacterales bacterium]